MSHFASRRSAAAACLAVAGVAMPAANALADTDACQLLAAPELSAALGVPIGAGTHTTPTYVKTCTWQPASGSTAKLRYVTLDVKAATRFDEGRQMLQTVGQGKVGITSLGGVGDEAFYATFGPRATSLNVKKGGVAFKLSVYGEMAPQSMPAEKTLAAEVVSKL